MKKLYTTFLFLIFLNTQPFAQPTITAIPGTGNIAYGISPAGNYVTGSSNSGGFLFRISGAVYTTIGGEEAWSVNDYGKVAGTYLDTAYQYNGVSFPIAGFYEAGAWSSPGLIPGVLPFSSTQYSYGYGLSNDGQNLCGMVWLNAGDTKAFTWNSTSGYSLLRDRNQSSKALCISGDGSKAGGWLQANTRIPVFWDPDSVVLTQNPGEVHFINHDGSVVAGTTNGDAFIWDSISGMQNLPLITGANSADAYGVSDSGVAVGFYTTGSLPPFPKSAFIYIPGQGMLDLRDYLISAGASNVPSVLEAALGISRNGRFIIAFGGFPRTSYVIELDSNTTSIPPVVTQVQPYVSPNPATTGKATLRGLPGGTPYSVIIMTMDGKRVLSINESGVHTGQAQEIELRNDKGEPLSNGLYLVRVLIGKSSRTIKLAVNNN